MPETQPRFGLPSGERQQRFFAPFFPKKGGWVQGANPWLVNVEHLGQLTLDNPSDEHLSNRRGYKDVATKCPYTIGFTQAGTIKAITCGMWSCPTCRKKLAAEWSKRAYLHVHEHGDTAFCWHLTLRPDVQNAFQGYLIIKVAWDNLRKQVQRSMGKFSYLAAVEAHPRRNKIPHFHIVTLAPAPYRLKDLAYNAGFGYIAKEEAIWSERGAAYVTKYASKYDPSIPKNFRRVRTSQDWTKLPPYAGPPLLVKARSETLASFIIRCSMLIDEEPETLLRRYRAALNHFELGELFQED
jgi:hypothetical protein